ncbi:MAG: VTT domain-containing protein [Acidobacteria bacterium]|nr:VTT domain-containing protein [Acidobacteriota bacterium]
MSVWLGYGRIALTYLHSFALNLGGPGLFFLAVADSSFLSLPEANDLLIVLLSKGESWGSMIYFVAMTVLGSALGCTLLYSVGRSGGSFIGRRLGAAKIDRAGQLFQRWGVWAIIIPCLLPPPTPFKIFVFTAGLTGVSFKKFIAAVLLGRSVRYLTWGILAVIYGEAARVFLQEKFKANGLLVILLLALLIAVLFKMKRSLPQEAA